MFPRIYWNSNKVFINDPLTGNKAQEVNKQSFIESWNALGKKHYHTAKKDWQA